MSSLANFERLTIPEEDSRTEELLEGKRSILHLVEDSGGETEQKANESKPEYEAGDTTEIMTLMLRETRRMPVLTASRELELAKRIEQGDAQAKEELLLSNMGLVVAKAKAYVGRGIPLPDLIQEGFIGLHKAVENFEWQRGYKFSTYADNWINTHIKDCVDQQAKLIRRPLHVARHIRVVQSLHSQLQQELGREPTEQDIREAIPKLTDLSPGAAENALIASKQQVYSLDKPLRDANGDDNFTLLDFVPDEYAHEEILDETEFNIAQDRVGRILSVLDEKTLQVVVDHNGLYGAWAKTYENIGLEQTEPVSGYAIRHIEERAFRRLSRNSQVLNIKKELEQA